MQIIPISSVKRRGAAQPASPCASATASPCASATAAPRASAPADMSPEIWAKVQDHPCYSDDAHHHFARMHVAVAPACNIQCNYCNRKYDCSNESRPGVVSEKLTPDQALRKVMAVAARVPQLSVLGIAGPGDALANPANTFRTMALVAEALPHLKLCLSTNGLALPDHVEAIRRAGVDHVTITINMVDPEIGEALYPWIFFDHKRWRGREAAAILHRRQMAGLEALTRAGVLVKVNSVLVPGINDGHLDAVNAAVKERGAFLHNVMPLISDPAHGTAFGLSGQRGPTDGELAAVQDRLSGGVAVMRHCRQCRADAVGLLGEDRGAEFTLDRLPDAPESPAFDSTARDAYLAVVERERADRRAAAAAAVKAAAGQAARPPLLVAVATKGGGRVNQHFGHAKEFQLWSADASGARLVGIRRVDQYCQGGYGEDEAMPSIQRALAGVAVVLVAKVGRCPREEMAAAGIVVDDSHAFGYIEAAVMACRQAHDDNALVASA